MNRKFNSEIEEQLHLKFDNEKNFLNMMQPTIHIYLFRSIINHHNNRLNKKCLRDFEKRLQFPVKRNDLGSLVYLIPSCSKDQSELEKAIIKSDENLEQCQSEFTESDADVPNNECSFREPLSHPNTDTKVGNNLKSYRNHQLDPEAQSNCETDNSSISETSDTQEVNADPKERPSSFTSITLPDNEKDIESNIFEKFFKADVSTIDNSWRTATIFSEEESLKNENEKFL